MLKLEAVQHGLIADFSSTSVPAVPAYSLGLAQLEEIQDALLDLRRTKQEKMGTGPDGWKSVAWTDTFHSQGQFLFASGELRHRAKQEIAG